MAYDGGMQDVAVTSHEPEEAPAASYAPKPAGGAQPAAAAGETGFTPASAKRVFMSPPGILRAVEWFLALILFATIVDSSTKGISYSEQSEFEYGVAIGILVWLYTMAMMVVMLLDLYASISILPLAELGADAIFCFLSFVAGIAVAARCNTEIGNSGGIKYCDGVAYGDKPRAGAAFGFLLSFALAGSAFFSVKRYQG